VTRPRRSQAADHVRLDDLLSAGVPLPPSRLVQQDRPWLVGTLLTAFLASAVVYMLLGMMGVRPSYPIILAACLGGLFVRQAARAVGEPPWLRVGDLVRPPRVPRRREPGTLYEGGDGMAAAVRGWSRLFEWGQTGSQADPGRFARTVGAPIGELVDERLRQRYGLTRASDPARARAIVGERLWALVGDREQPVSQREVVAAVADLERMWVDENFERKA
jgi:hypothetical protein